MAWPWRRFEEMFKRHMLRRAKDRVEHQCDLQIAAINANSSWDGEDNADAKRSRIQQIETTTRELIAFIYSDPEEMRRQEEEDPYSMENDPLFASTRRAREQAQSPLPEQAGQGADMMQRMAAVA